MKVAAHLKVKSGFVRVSWGYILQENPLFTLQNILTFDNKKQFKRIF